LWFRPVISPLSTLFHWKSILITFFFPFRKYHRLWQSGIHNVHSGSASGMTTLARNLLAISQASAGVDRPFAAYRSEQKHSTFPICVICWSLSMCPRSAEMTKTNTVNFQNGKNGVRAARFPLILIVVSG